MTYNVFGGMLNPTLLLLLTYLLTYFQYFVSGKALYLAE